MSALMSPRPMAKSPVLPAKLHADVVESARLVAALKKVQIQDLLSDILRPVLAEMEREEISKRADLSAKPPKRGPKS